MYRSQSRFLLSLFMLSVFAAAAPAQQERPTAVPAESWTVDDILLRESAGSFQVSSNRQWVVWVRTTVDREKGVASNLWLTRLSNLESWALTRGHARNTLPQWSPDGRFIAFRSTRDLPEADDDSLGAQIWLLRLAGGEPWPITTSVRGLGDFGWKGVHSDTIVFVAREAKTRFEQHRARTEDRGRAVEDSLAAAPVRLWSVAARSKSIHRLTDNRDWIESMALSLNGERAVVRVGVSLSYTYDSRVPPKTFLVELDTGRRREILADEKIVPHQLEWSRDGKGIYFSYGYSTHPVYWNGAHTLMGYYNVEDGRLTRIDLDWERGLGGGFEVVPGGFIAMLADGVHDRPTRYELRKKQWKGKRLDGEHTSNMWEWGASGDGTMIVYSTSTASSPEQPYAARLLRGRITNPRRLVDLNPGYATKRKPRTEVIHWRGASDEEVEGVLHYPIPYQAGRRYPLVVSIHGGPTRRDRDAWESRWSDPYVLFSQMGAFVFQPNYHGSCCYGLDWVESIAGGKFYSLEIPDIELGVDYLVERGLVHPDSIATQGWSNGAILSIELTTRNPERYQAASVGAGDVEWISDWGNVDFGASFDNYYFGASPLEDPERYIAMSPFFRLDRVRTPTLIFFGTEDRRVPPSQGWSHFRALQQLGNTDVRFVLFPGEPHELRRLAHQRRKVVEELAWFERYLWGKADTTNLAVERDSPLGTLIARSVAQRYSGLYGIPLNGALVPETVRRGEIAVGRFEVTRAQWQTFDNDYSFLAGTENYPVGGISFDAAKAYVEWLSERTGRAYRLPRVDEMEELVAQHGITLDYWAGYDLNPEDAERLLQAVERLPGDAPAPLLVEVGSFGDDASGSPPHIFDLGGNVAEWATAGDGSGWLRGGSADRPKESGPRLTEAAPPYRGLRVVRDT